MGIIVIVACVCAALAAAAFFYKDLRDSRRAETRRQQLVSRLRPK